MKKPEAVEWISNNQRQLDMDGCEVGVSRQALDETLAWAKHLEDNLIAISEMTERDQDDHCRMRNIALKALT